MKFYSTNNRSHEVTLREAVLKGLAADGGLYIPEYIPELENSFFSNLEKKNIPEIAFEVLGNFTKNEIDLSDLRNIVEDAFNFDAPVVSLDEKYKVLELFHGPTLAFKDFGARFMARTMSHFIKGEDKTLNILVATSGDTGSAVANGFYKTEGINVFILYPKEKVSEIQEKQLTTLGENITALEIEGTFDDCQALVKQAFVDKELNERLVLSSANSINIARLLPQSIYYFNAYKQVSDGDNEVVVCVPSGNLGNLTAGLFASEMGLPIKKFIAATNANSVFSEYVNSGVFTARSSVKTISNAMDVGNPSNLARINELYKNDINIIRKVIFSNSHTDEQTKEGIREVYDKYNYLIDPHGSVGYLAMKDYFESSDSEKETGIILETAHPAKFKEDVENVLGININLPLQLQEVIGKEKVSVQLSNKYEHLKDFLFH